MISISGLMGGAVGLYLGWLNYRLLIGYLQAAVTKRKERSPAKVSWVEQADPMFRKIIFVLTFVGIPVVGYLAGADLA